MEGTAFWSSPQNPGRTTRVWGRRVLTVVGDRGPGMRPGSVRPPLGPDTDGPVGAATGGPGRRNHGRAPGDGGSPARRPSSRSARQLAPIPGRRRGGLQRQGAARSAPRGGDRLAPSAWPVYFWSRRRQPLPDLTPAPSRRIVHGRERAWPSLNLPVLDSTTALPSGPTVSAPGVGSRLGADVDGKARRRRPHPGRTWWPWPAPGHREAGPSTLDDRSQSRIRRDMRTSATRSPLPAARTHMSRPGPPFSTGSVGA